jgi:hypothetical protein
MNSSAVFSVRPKNDQPRCRPPISSAPFDDLDLDRPEDEAEWDRRVMVRACPLPKE